MSELADQIKKASQKEAVKDKQVREAFENGLTVEQVELFARPEFTKLKMYQLRLAFEKGLSIEQVKVIANPKFSSNKMMDLICEFNKKRA